MNPQGSNSAPSAVQLNSSDLSNQLSILQSSQNNQTPIYYQIVNPQVQQQQQQQHHQQQQQQFSVLGLQGLYPAGAFGLVQNNGQAVKNPVQQNFQVLQSGGPQQQQQQRIPGQETNSWLTR